MNDETRRQGEEFLGYLSQAWGIPSENFRSPRKQETFWDEHIPKKLYRLGRRKFSTRRQDQRPLRQSVDQAEEKNLCSSRGIDSERKFVGNFGASSIKRLT